MTGPIARATDLAAPPTHMPQRPGADVEPASGEADRLSRLRHLFLLALAAWTVTYGRFALSPIQEAMKADLALTDNQVAWIQGPAVAMPMALSAIPISLVIDRFRFERLFPVLIGTIFLASVTTALASSLLLMILSRCIVGVALAATLVGTYSCIGRVFAPAQRGRAGALVVVGEAGGAPAVFAAGGLLLVWLGGTAEDWRMALLYTSMPLALVALLMFGLPSSAAGPDTPRGSSTREICEALWAERRLVVPLLLARVMFWISLGAVLVWAAPAFARKYELPADQIGVLMATALLISGVAGPLIAGPMADWCQRSGGPGRTMLALALAALLSVPVALFIVLPNPTMAGIALAIFLSIANVVATAELAIILVVLPPVTRSTYLGASIAIGSLFCYALAPLTVSGLSTLLGGPGTIGVSLAIICGATSVAGAGIFAWGSRVLSARVEDGHDE